MNELQQQRMKKQLRESGVTGEMSAEDFSNRKTRAKKLLRGARQIEQGPPDPFRVALGAQIREQRAARKLDLYELAAKSKVAYSNLSKIERGLINASVDTLQRIAGALEADLRIEFVRKYRKD